MSTTQQVTEKALSSKYIADLDDLYGQVDEFQFDRVPDGIYDAKLENLEITEASTGSVMLQWEFLITGPHFAGRRVWKNSVLPKNPTSAKEVEQAKQRLSFIKRDLRTIGYTGSLAVALENASVLSEYLGREMQITTKINGEYQNVTLRRDVTVVEDVVSASDVA